MSKNGKKYPFVNLNLTTNIQPITLNDRLKKRREKMIKLFSKEYRIKRIKKRYNETIPAVAVINLEWAWVLEAERDRKIWKANGGK